MSRMFRLLRADEIECRVSTVNEKGCSVLLYKDARCDMNILDETVGAMSWQKRYSRDNANCEVGIYCKERNEWIWKEDTGTKSNTEEEKGLASDSFKRACFNWGIGRELYTAPFIWIKVGDVELKEGRNGKKTTYDKFDVDSIDYDDAGRINQLVITKKGKIVYQLGKAPKNAPQTDAQADDQHVQMVEKQPIGDVKARALEELLSDNGIAVTTVYALYKVKKLSELNEKQHANIVANLHKIKEKQNGEQSKTA